MNKIIIGVYHELNSINISGEERVKAALDEAEKQNVRLVFYTNDDINFSENIISGLYKDSSKDKDWKRIETVIPEVTINQFPSAPSKQTLIEKRLRSKTIFTSYLTIGKYDYYKILIKSDIYGKYAIESKKIEDFRDILESLDRNKKVVIKPINGRQGNNIYMLYRKKDKYIFIEEGQHVEFTDEQFKMYIDELVRSDDYIVQPYIEARTRDGEPYDFRIHLHRDKNGEWAVVKTYPRIGNRKGILSNISKGGRTVDIDNFLKNEFGEESLEVKKDIEGLAIDLANYINSFVNYKINEVGVDIAIDKKGHYYTYEINGGPESKYHNKERAKYVIEYAKYKYDNYIKNKKEVDLKKISKELLKLEHRLVEKDFEDEIYVGILTDPNGSEQFNKAASFRGFEENINLFYFYPSDINKRSKSIDGRYYNESKVEVKKFPYPDVIIDRLRMKELNNFDEVYEELKDIPFNTDRPGGSIEKKFMYDIFEGTEFDKYIIPYKYNPDIKDIFVFLEKYESIILKPDLSSGGHGIIKIEKRENQFIYRCENKRKLMSKEDLDIFFNKNIKEKFYILQKYIKSEYKENRPFDARIHMVKNGFGEWELVMAYCKVGSKNSLISNRRSNGYKANIIDVLGYLFKEDKQRVYNDIIHLCYKFNVLVEKNIDNRICEIGYDVAITDEGELYLFEINVNRPNPLFYEYELAERLVPYAIYLAKEDRKQKERI